MAIDEMMTKKCHKPLSICSGLVSKLFLFLYAFYISVFACIALLNGIGNDKDETMGDGL